MFKLCVKLIVLSLLVPLLSACAREQDSPPPTVSITFACQDWQISDFEKLAEEFHTLNPGIQVHVVPLPEAPDDDSQDFGAGLAAATDTIGGVGALQEMSAGWFRNLQPFIESDDTFEPDDFYPGMLQAYRWNGGQWAVPAQAGFYLVRYDEDAFDQAGVAYPQAGWTWDELAEKATQLTQRQGDAVTRQGFVDTGRIAFLSLIASQGETLLDETTSPPTPLLDQPKLAEALQWYAAWAPVDHAAQAAMWIGSSADSYPLEERNLGVAPFPRGEIAVGPMWVQGYAMSAGAQHPDASWRWLAFLSRRPIPNPGPGQTCPARRSVAVETGFWQELDQDLGAVIRDALQQRLLPLGRMSGLHEPLLQALEAVLQGQGDAQTALAQAQARATLAGVQQADPVVVAQPRPEPSGETVTIRFMEAGMFESHYRGLIKEFQAQNSQITVQFVQVPPMGNLGVEDWAERADCFPFFGTTLSDPQGRANFVNLQPFLDQDEDFPLDDFYPQALADFRWEGDVWGLPSEASVQVIAYNKALFDADQVPYPRPGWTLDELASTAQALTNGQGNDKQYGFVAYPNDLSVLYSMIERMAGELVDYDSDPPRIRFDDPAVVQAVQWYADLALVQEVKPTYPINYSQLTANMGQEQQALITSGRAAMWTTLATWVRPDQRLYFGFPDDIQIGVAPRPLQPGGKGYGSINFSGYVISSQSPHPQACWEWLVFLTGRTGRQGDLPARRSVAESEAFRQLVGADFADTYLFTIAHQDADSPTRGESARRGVNMYWFYAAYDRIIAGEEASTALAWAQEMTEAYQACALGREDLEGQELYQTCATEVDPDYYVEWGE